MTLYDLINRDIDCSCGRTHCCDIEYVKICAHALEALPDATIDCNINIK